jgi:hypothetical protein
MPGEMPAAAQGKKREKIKEGCPYKGNAELNHRRRKKKSASPRNRSMRAFEIFLHDLLFYFFFFFLILFPFLSGRLNSSRRS